MQYFMGAMGPMSNGMGMNSSTGQSIGMPIASYNPSFNMASLINSCQPSQSVPSMHQQTSNTELMQFLNVKFEEVNKRLEKLDTQGKRVNEIDGKVSKLWSDLDKRVTRNTERVTNAEEKADSNEFEIREARKNISELQKQNQSLKDTLTDIQPKSMISNLIIGGLDEAQDGMAEDVGNTVRAFMFEDLMIPRENPRAQIERVQRTGTKALQYVSSGFYCRVITGSPMRLY